MQFFVLAICSETQKHTHTKRSHLEREETTKTLSGSESRWLDSFRSFRKGLLHSLSIFFLCVFFDSLVRSANISFKGAFKGPRMNEPTVGSGPKKGRSNRRAKEDKHQKPFLNTLLRVLFSFSRCGPFLRERRIETGNEVEYELSFVSRNVFLAVPNDRSICIIALEQVPRIWPHKTRARCWKEGKSCAHDDSFCWK